jgi:hypothetical protein
MIAGNAQRLDRPRVIEGSRAMSEVFVPRRQHNGLRSSGPLRPIG